MRIALAIVAVFAAALTCACGARQAPKQRYIAALNHKMEGDPQAYYDELVALAHDAPDTRAGRRARATLSSGGLATDIAVLGVIAAMAIPRFNDLRERAVGDEAREQLRALAATQRSFHSRHQRYCTSFAECGWSPPDDAQYFYYLSLDEVAGGGAAGDPSLLRLRAESTLAAMGTKPVVNDDGFFAMAVGDPDGDGELDVWAIDQGDAVVNLLKD